MKKLQVLDFYAEWCGPCRTMIPTIDSLIKEHNSEESKIEFKKVNVDSDPELSEKYNVTSIPVLVFVKDGEEVERLRGIQSKEAITKRIEMLSI